MLRRNALPLLGLFRTDILVVDLEFSLRVTSQVDLAWYTGVLAARIDNAASNWRTMNARAVEESNGLWGYYALRPVGAIGAGSETPRRVTETLRSNLKLRTRLRTTRTGRRIDGLFGRTEGSQVADHRKREPATPGLGGAPDQAAAACDSMLATWYRELPAGFIRTTGGLVRTDQGSR